MTSKCKHNVTDCLSSSGCGAFGERRVGSRDGPPQVAATSPQHLPYFSIRDALTTWTRWLMFGRASLRWKFIFCSSAKTIDTVPPTLRLCHAEVEVSQMWYSAMH